jgi:glycosyltransferase involved in cell wall biosynthesis
VPVVASRIPGLIGTLGKNFPGYFPVGNTQRLANLLRRSESDKKFYRRLQRHCEKLSYLVRPKRELDAWRSLLREVSPNKSR